MARRFTRREQPKIEVFLDLDLDFSITISIASSCTRMYVCIVTGVVCKRTSRSVMSQLQLPAGAEHWALGMATVVHHLALGNQHRASALAQSLLQTNGRKKKEGNRKAQWSGDFRKFRHPPEQSGNLVKIDRWLAKVLPMLIVGTIYYYRLFFDALD